MKLIKLASLALAAVGTFGVYNAGAAVLGVTTNSTKLTVAITVKTNIAEKVSSGNSSTNYTYSTKTLKIDNKFLLTLFQNWSTNPFGTGTAKLVIGWDSPWYGDVLVVDKTGTNVLFDATTGASNGEGSAYFEVYFDDEYGAYTGSYKNAYPGSYSETDYNTSYYELWDNGYYLPYTSIWGYGSSTFKNSENWDKNNNPTKWSLSGTATVPLQGDIYANDSDAGSASAKFSSSGTGKNGWNPYFNN